MSEPLFLDPVSEGYAWARDIAARSPAYVEATLLGLRAGIRERDEIIARLEGQVAEAERRERARMASLVGMNARIQDWEAFLDGAGKVLRDAEVLCELVRDFANHDDVPCYGETCAYCYSLITHEKIHQALGHGERCDVS
jgi:hypothetical protein